MLVVTKKEKVGIIIKRDKFKTELFGRIRNIFKRGFICRVRVDIRKRFGLSKIIFIENSL